jgi:hypothetical protein
LAERKNPSLGAKPDKFLRDALIVALHREAAAAKGKAKTKKLFLLADKLVDRALEGDVGAIREIFDRVEGKAMQRVEAGVSILDRMSHDDQLVLAAALTALAGESDAAATDN